LPQPFNEAIRTEMQIFAKLIQRREPRNMIRTLFLGRLDHDRFRKAGGIPASVEEAVATVSAVLDAKGEAGTELTNALVRAGFQGPLGLTSTFDGLVAQTSFWLEAEPDTGGKRALRERLAHAYAVADKWRNNFSEDQRRAADYLLVKKHGFPAYLGGVFSFSQPGA
jgi:3-hydroxyacyl-CoA dehydrogenase/enoyl-CoA hydratase/3-hydroxybutyryl-CoA epimerase